jgi:DeoR/GlpR family transcriptional regulator of sugar metabolism
MLAHERQERILEILREKTAVKNTELAERFKASNLTIRRDLDVLVDRGLVRRVYGGAVLSEEPGGAEPLRPGADSLSEQRQVRRKAIAAAAVTMVREGDRVHLGNGTILIEIARQLRQFRQLSIVTGSLSAAFQLINTSHEVYVLGGRLHHDERNLSGSYAIRMAGDFRTNVTIIPCAGVSVDYGVMSDYLPAAELGRVAVENAEKSILVCSSKKIGRAAFHHVCPVAALDVIITDDGITPEQKEALEACGVQVVVVHGEAEENE